jgi:hypothetical protein
MDLPRPASFRILTERHVTFSLTATRNDRVGTFNSQCPTNINGSITELYLSHVSEQHIIKNNLINMLVIAKNL